METLDPTDTTQARLENQIAWYGNKSEFNQRAFKVLKTLQILAAAVIPLLAGFGVSAKVAGILGVVIVTLEGVQQLNQYQQNWITYRATGEALKHEKYTFLARAGPYRKSTNPTALLAERIEGLISQEHAKWTNAMEESTVGAADQEG
jgi:hypothetical protein